MFHKIPPYVSIFVICNLWQVHSTGHIDVAAKFREFQIVPDLPIEPPTEACNVTYSNAIVNFGNELTPTQVKDHPNVKWNADPNSTYAVFMLDLDSPNRTHPTEREWQHWFVANIRGDRVDLAETLSGYLGAMPIEHTGLHRYVFLVYKQPGYINFDHMIWLDDQSKNRRPDFKVAEFAKSHKFGNPIAGNFFQAKWDDWVPDLRLQVKNWEREW